MVLQVHRREDIYRGDQVHRLPDLIVCTDRQRYVSFGHADFGSNHLLEESFGQTGHHTITGILAMRGPGVRQGVRLENAHILDLAPTILHLLRLPIPEYMDGHPLEEALVVQPTETPAAASRPSWMEPSPQAGAAEYSPEDEEAVRRRLKDLGYLG